jgi:hypothetical protein
MNTWGVHRVNIEIMQWGDVWHSYDVLKERSAYAHVRRMLKEIEDRYRRGRPEVEPVCSPTVQPVQVAMAVPAPAPASTRPSTPAAPAKTSAEKTWPKAIPVTAPASPAPVASPSNWSAPASVASNPFFR